MKESNIKLVYTIGAILGGGAAAAGLGLFFATHSNFRSSVEEQAAAKGIGALVTDAGAYAAGTMGSGFLGVALAVWHARDKPEVASVLSPGLSTMFFGLAAVRFYHLWLAPDAQMTQANGTALVTEVVGFSALGALFGIAVPKNLPAVSSMPGTYCTRVHVYVHSSRTTWY